MNGTQIKLYTTPLVKNKPVGVGSDFHFVRRPNGHSPAHCWGQFQKRKFRGKHHLAEFLIILVETFHPAFVSSQVQRKHSFNFVSRNWPMVARQSCIPSKASKTSKEKRAQNVLALPPIGKKYFLSLLNLVFIGNLSDGPYWKSNSGVLSVTAKA